MFSNSKKLTEEQKEKLWNKYFETHSIEVRNQIIEEYACLVKIIANKLSLYLGSNVEYEDLCSYGIMGLIDAIDKFDLGANVKFETYASLRIRGEILDNIRKMDWIPRSVRAKQKKIQEVRSRLQDNGVAHPSDEDMAMELDLSVEEYLEWEKQLLGTTLLSIDEPMTEDSDSSNTPAKMLEQTVYELPEEHIDKQDLKAQLQDAMELLTDKEKLTIQLIYYEDLSAREAANVMEVTESRVSQLHTKALNKMKEKMGKYMGVMVTA